jgi:hypothetical protein
MASVEPVDEFQERVARYVDERLGPILREVNRLDDLLSTETIERTLLEEKIACFENVMWECPRGLYPTH